MSVVEFLQIGFIENGGWASVYDPRRRFGVISSAHASSPDEFPDSSSGALVIAILKSGSATSANLRDEVEQWVGAPSNAGAFELVFRPWRILFNDMRAAVEGQSSPNDVLAAIISHYEIHATIQDDRIRLDDLWPTMSADLKLLHALTSADLKHQSRINEFTRTVGAGRLHLARAEAFLDDPESSLSATSRRILLEMVQLSRALERIKALDIMTEAAEDFYDRANDRLTEYRYYRSEVLVDSLILVSILIETLYIICRGVV